MGPKTRRILLTALGLAITTPSETESRMSLDYLSTLNTAQRQAVETTEGPVLILAGAGTGKTRVLISRMAHLLATGKAWPSQILAVTFTNKAAREMKDRVQSLVGMTGEGVWLGTFHSICVRILRRHAELVGLTPDFTILDTDDQLRLIKQFLQAENIDVKKVPPRMVAALISRWKDRALMPDQVPLSDDSNWGSYSLLQLYKDYQARLQILNAVDFGDLLLLTLNLFKNHPEVLTQYQNQFKYIMVDEYQDTNVAQYQWLKLLAQGTGNICCVGDDDQSIYGWRGAEIGNILKFEQDFPGATVIKLEQNYRSTGHILKAASGFIAHNQGRLGKELWTDGDMGDKVRVHGVWDGIEEARFVGDEVEALQRKGESLSHMAVLVRAGFQTREFEERFLTLGLPYRVVGGPRFYERQEIRDALAYIRLVVNREDSLAFERIVNTPRRGIGAATVQILHQLSRSQGISLARAAEKLIETDEIRGRARTALQGLLQQLEGWSQLLDKERPGDLAGLLLDESGYTAMWKQDKSPDAPGRLENLKELVAAVEEFDTLHSFLEHVSLVTEAQEDATVDKVTIMTVHSAKGLEFDTVFLAGWEEGLFPHPRSIEESGDAGLEEERRLAYVGLTRARKQAIIMYAANRKHYKGWQAALPSRFLQELPEPHIDVRSVPNMSRHDHGSTYDRPRTLSYGARLQKPSSGLVSFSAQEPLLQLGDRVFHNKFGYGLVIEVEGDRVEVNFDHTGPKRVLSTFLEKA